VSPAPTSEQRRDLLPGPESGSQAVLRLPGLLVAAATTAHGLSEVAVAAHVPPRLAWTYPATNARLGAPLLRCRRGGGLADLDGVACGAALHGLRLSQRPDLTGATFYDLPPLRSIAVRSEE
jgi:hypothetical protein